MQLVRRKVMTSTRDRSRRCRTRNARVSRVAGSAQWRSSTTSSTGASPTAAGAGRGARRAGGPASNSRWSCAGDDGRAERRDEAGEIGPRRPDHGLELGRVERRGRASRERLDDRPVREPVVADVGAARRERTRKPARRRSVASSPTSRDLPTPASPAISRWIGTRRRRRRAPRPGVELGRASDRDRADEAADHGLDHRLRTSGAGDATRWWCVRRPWARHDGAGGEPGDGAVARVTRRELASTAVAGRLRHRTRPGGRARGARWSRRSWLDPFDRRGDGSPADIDQDADARTPRHREDSSFSRRVSRRRAFRPGQFR